MHYNLPKPNRNEVNIKVTSKQKIYLLKSEQNIAEFFAKSIKPTKIFLIFKIFNEYIFHLVKFDKYIYPVVRFTIDSNREIFQE